MKHKLIWQSGNSTKQRKCPVCGQYSASQYSYEPLPIYADRGNVACFSCVERTQSVNRQQAEGR